MSAATVGSARSVTAGPRESPTGEWCLRCWDKHRQRTAADAVLDDTPYCEPCALLLGFTPEEIAAARLLPKAVAAKPAAAEGGIGEEKMPERAAVDVAAGPSTAPQPSSALPARRVAPGSGADRMCACGCGRRIGAKNTSGMCPNCYAREAYRAKHHGAKQKPGPKPGKTAARQTAAPAAPPMPEAPAALARPAATAVAESVSVQLPVALLDAWWPRLDAQAKADQFLEVFSKALTL